MAKTKTNPSSAAAKTNKKAELPSPAPITTTKTKKNKVQVASASTSKKRKAEEETKETKETNPSQKHTKKSETEAKTPAVEAEVEPMDEAEDELDAAVAWGDAMFANTDEEKEGDESEDEERQVSDRELLMGIDDGDSSEGEDSSDDEAMQDDDAIALGGGEDEFAVGRGAIALDPKNEAILKKKLQKLSKIDVNTKTGVVYLGRVPHGFYENEMRGYFKQFGEITRLRLSRNKKTGKSKHFAFIEFRSNEVAEIVAETMNNYLLFGHLLKCVLMQPERLHPDIWKGANRKYRMLPRAANIRAAHGKAATAEDVEKRNKKIASRNERRSKRIKAAGIDYEFPARTEKK